MTEPEKEREIVSSEEFAVAMAELELAGLIEYKPGDDEEFDFTDKGDDYAWELWFKLPAKERVVLWLLTDIIRGCGEAIERSEDGNH